ncbi:DUF3231 family protein [Bacillus litorisediminis]|uniref:DUF3231 family protein n=1 Tax=Bacillus litorisediminis TaxID=2922713 RepID=UPI001FAD7509|nr:DUF3231 family protein [Bacillus litorisediminis]
MQDIPAITSSELSTLWLTYQEKTMNLRILEYFIEKAEDEKSKDLMTKLYEEMNPYVEKIKEIFQNEGAVIPIGYTSQDVNKEVPKLYDNGFDIMFMRMLNEISMGLHALNITMAYREDIVTFYKELTALTQKYYNLCTQYLLEKGMLARPPFVTMPNSVEFVKSTSYLGDINPFSRKRTLNTIEVAHIFHAIETNSLGMQMILGFAQCANDREVKEYLNEGAELAKSIIKELSETLLGSEIRTPEVSGGNATRSTVAPFSDKLMMYCTSLFCSFSIGGNSLGTAFSLRNDLPLKITVFIKDIFEYAHKGAKLMIQKGWMEEPPQMEERDQIIKK